MKLENVKSFILVVLIGISILLSFILWNYQPNSTRTIGGETINREMDAGGSSNETKRNLIKPSDIIFHIANSHYGFINAKDQDALYEEMQNWVVTDFGSNANRGDAASMNGLELIFSDDIPMEIVNSLFVFGSEDVVLPSWSMDRISIRFIHDSKSLQLRFLSNSENRSASAVVNDTNAYETLWSMFSDFDDDLLREYISIGEGTTAYYIPKDRVVLPTYSITPKRISPESFVNILFSNPAVVRETSSQSIGETYFTDSRQLSVYQDRMRMEFVYHVTPAASDEGVSISGPELLDRTILNINNHSGWTGNYRLEELNTNFNRITFKLYYDGYPVFSSLNLSTIQQRWGVQQNSVQLIEYDRPLYQFESEFGFWEDDLISGSELMAYLEDNPNEDLENIEYIKVGFELKYQRDDQGSEYLQLDPAWYKKENNIWQKIIFEDSSNGEGVD